MTPFLFHCYYHCLPFSQSCVKYTRALPLPCRGLTANPFLLYSHFMSLSPILCNIFHDAASQRIHFSSIPTSWPSPRSCVMYSMMRLTANPFLLYPHFLSLSRILCECVRSVLHIVVGYVLSAASHQRLRCVRS